jgi:DNA-binding GntR family transcriptional regulator
MMNNSPKTDEEIAYERLRNLIISGELPINEFLSQRKLSEQVGSAVVTVRAALRSLESEGLIENIPRWGVRIPEETEEVLRDRYFMREVLEVAAMRRILNQNNPEHLKVLVDMAERCDQVESEEPTNMELFSKVHYDFHRAIAELSGSPLLLEALDRIHLRTLMLYNAHRGWGRGRDRVTHVALMHEIMNGDWQHIKETMRHHIRRGLQHELEFLGERISI